MSRKKPATPVSRRTGSIARPSGVEPARRGLEARLSPRVDRNVERTPKATNWSQFYDSTNGSRNPGDWPSLLRRSWEMRYGQVEGPYPYGPDQMQSRGARASQYSS